MRILDETCDASRHPTNARDVSDLPRGFTFAGHHCGLKSRELDLGILISEKPAVAAAVFTGNQVAAAPVIASRSTCKKSREECAA